MNRSATIWCFSPLLYLVLLLPKSSLEAQQVTIISPADGTVVSPGQAVNVSVSVSGGTVLAVEVVGEDIGGTGFQSTGPYTFAIGIPTGLIGKINLTAVGLVGVETAVFSQPISLDIEPALTISNLTADTTSISFQYAGQQLPLHVSATFNDGSFQDVTGSTLISYSSDTPDVASVDPTGVVTATKAGTAIISIASASLKATVSITVPAYVKGDLDGDGVVTTEDMLVLESFLGSTSLGSFDARDLNGDGKIDDADLALLLSFCGSSCPALAGTQTSLSSSPNPSVHGQQVVLTALTASSAGVPAGVVTFFDGGNFLGMAAPDATGSAVFAANALSAGTHNFSALYSGNGNFAPSRSGILSQTVQPRLTGDVNDDGVVDCTDMQLVKASFGLRLGQFGFDPRSDINGDKVVNVVDLAAVARQLPAGTACQ